MYFKLVSYSIKGTFYWQDSSLLLNSKVHPINKPVVHVAQPTLHAIKRVSWAILKSLLLML